MNKFIMYGVGVLLAIGLALPAIAARPEVPAGPLKMALTKKPVMFDHSKHVSIDCGVCHHQVDGKETFARCASSGCHDVIGNKAKDWNSYYRLAHDRKLDNSCLGCHVKIAKKDKSKRKALTSCKGSSCHVS